MKVAPVLRLAVTFGLSHTVWSAGQHRESIDDLFSDFKLASKVVTSGTQEERSSVGSLLMWLPGTLFNCLRYVRDVATREHRRPLVVVHGDTLSTFIGALAGKMAGGDVVHLESGLSSKKWSDPFPEEILRRLTFRLTRYALCPNADAGKRMRLFRNCEVVETGANTLLDCVRYGVAVKDKTNTMEAGTYFVASIHRFQNIYRKSKLNEIVNELLAVSREGRVHFVLHPATERRLRRTGIMESLEVAPGIQVESRMPFTRFLNLLAGARGVFSDGGSNQEELSYLGVPTVLYRERSERPDGLHANVILRKDIGEPLLSFVVSGKLADLRQPRSLCDDLQPSQTTVQALLRWSERIP